MQKSRVSTEDTRLHSKKSFIWRSTSRDDADNPGPSPSFSSPSPYLLLLSSRAIELCLATTLTWSDRMRWCPSPLSTTAPFIVSRGIGGTYRASSKSVEVTWAPGGVVGPWLAPKGGCEVGTS